MSGSSVGHPRPTGTTAAYLTPFEVSDLLRVSEKTVCRWAGDPRTKIPCVRIKGTLRFNRVALERWLEAGGQKRRRLTPVAAGSLGPDAKQPMGRQMRSPSNPAPAKETSS